MDAEEFVNVVEDFINTYDSDKIKDAGKKLSRIHPTLQQNFMRLVLSFVKAETENPYTDARNNATVELSKKIMESLKDSKYFSNGEFWLPFI